MGNRNQRDSWRTIRLFLLLVGLVSLLPTPPAHAAILATTITAGSTTSIDDEVGAGGTTLDVPTMLTNAVSGVASFTATRLESTGILTIACPTTSGGWTTDRLEVLIDSGSSAVAASVASYFEVSGVLGMGSSITLLGGTYTHSAGFVSISTGLTIEDGSYLTIKDGTHTVIANAVDVPSLVALLGTDAVTVTSSGSLLITSNVMTASSTTVTGSWNFAVFDASGSSNTISVTSLSTVSISNNSIGIVDLITTVRYNLHIFYADSSPISITDDSVLSVDANTMTSTRITVGAQWNLYVFRIVTSPTTVSTRGSLTVSNNIIAGIDSDTTGNWVFNLFSATGFSPIVISDDSTVAVDSNTISATEVVVGNHLKWYLIYPGTSSIGVSNNGTLSLSNNVLLMDTLSTIGYMLLVPAWSNTLLQFTTSSTLTINNNNLVASHVDVGTYCAVYFFLSQQTTDVVLMDGMSSLSISANNVSVNDVTVGTNWITYWMSTGSSTTITISATTTLSMINNNFGSALFVVPGTITISVLRVDETLEMPGSSIAIQGTQVAGAVSVELVNIAYLNGLGGVMSVTNNILGGGSVMSVTSLGTDVPSIEICSNYVGNTRCHLDGVSSSYSCSSNAVLDGHIHECTSSLTTTDTQSHTPTKSNIPPPTLSRPASISHTHTPTTYEVDYSNDTTRRTCPTVVMALYRTINGTSTLLPSTTIQDTDVREGRLSVRVSLASTTFAFRTAMPSTVGFSVESLGVQDPRSFPAVANTADVVCGFAPLSSRTYIVCTFPVSSDYTLRAAETLVVQGGGSGLSPPCTDDPWWMGSIRVEPTTEDVVQQVLQVATTVAASVATVVVMLLADGTPTEIQLMIVLLNSACASDVDRNSVVIVRYFLSPAIQLGWSWVVVVNVCIALGFAALHTVLVVAVVTYRVRQDPRLDAQKKDTFHSVASTLLYPGLPLLLCHVLYMGVACGTFDVLRATLGAEAAVSALGIVFLMAVPTIDVYLLRKVAVAYVPYEALGCVPKTGWLTWMYPRGVWGPTYEVRRYFGLIGPYRNGYRYGVLLPLCLSLLIALALHALTEATQCDYIFVTCAVGGIVVGVGFIAVRPTRATAQSILTALSLVLVGLLATMQIVAIRANSVSVEASKSAIGYCIVIMIIVRSVHNVFVYYSEWKWAREVDAKAEAAIVPATTKRINPDEVDKSEDESNICSASPKSSMSQLTHHRSEAAMSNRLPIDHFTTMLDQHAHDRIDAGSTNSAASGEFNTSSVSSVTSQDPMVNRSRHDSISMVPVAGPPRVRSFAIRGGVSISLDTEEMGNISPTNNQVMGSRAMSLSGTDRNRRYSGRQRNSLIVGLSEPPSPDRQGYDAALMNSTSGIVVGSFSSAVMMVSRTSRELEEREAPLSLSSSVLDTPSPSAFHTAGPPLLLSGSSRPNGNESGIQPGDQLHAFVRHGELASRSPNVNLHPSMGLEVPAEMSGDSLGDRDMFARSP